MLKQFTRVKKSIISIFFLFFVAIGFINAQSENPVPDIEKVYLHTDRSTYIIGEDLWYKAYSVFAYNNLLFSKGNVLYVELISPDSKIVTRNKTLIKEGLGHGDFKLADSVGVKPGVYQIRAYTNWSRNFDDDFVFKKEIEVLDVFKDATDRNKTDNQSNQKSTKIITEVLQNTININFFPEGGSLLENTSSVVAFKATDNFGNAVNVKGKVFNSDNALVALFLSTYQGMGKFKFNPVKGKNYYAVIKTPDGKEVKQALPIANQQGYQINYKKVKNKNIITLKTNQETLLQNPDAQVTLMCKTRGVTYYKGSMSLSNKVLSFELPGTNFPEGISQLTLYDHNMKPQSERLIYIEKEHDLNVILTTDKTSYKPEEKVIINVSSKSKTNEGQPASFSLSVTDMNGAETDKDLGTNICSNFLLESDIRGKVYNPGYYFDESNPRRLQHLDVLLLTQGWRDFLWKTIPQPNDSILFKAENGFTISGKVEQLFGEKPKVDQNITLALMSKSSLNLHDTKTDSLGSFIFKDLLFMGKTNMFLNSRNDRGKSRGEIILNTIDKLPMPVNYKKTDSFLLKIDSVKQALSEHVYKKYITYGIAPENVLDEIEIIVKKEEQGPESLYGPGDNTYIVDADTPYFTDIFQLIQYTIPGVSTFGGTIGFPRFGGNEALILIDGMEWEQDLLSGISVDDVAKIEAFKGPSAAIFGLRGGNGVILIYTKEGTIGNQHKKVFHTISKEMEGFYSERVFYSSNPEDPKPEWSDKTAIRNTIYWNPYVHPDATGNATETYYNSAVQANVKVALEGITASGIPVIKKVYYTIE